MDDAEVPRLSKAPTSGRPQQTTKPRLLIFNSKKSGRSRRVGGYLSQVLQRSRNHQTFDIVRVDADTRVDLVERLKVTTIPELLVVEGTKVQARVRMPRGIADLKAGLAPWLRG